MRTKEVDRVLAAAIKVGELYEHFRKFSGSE